MDNLIKVLPDRKQNIKSNSVTRPPVYNCQAGRLNLATLHRNLKFTLPLMGGTMSLELFKKLEITEITEHEILYSKEFILFFLFFGMEANTWKTSLYTVARKPLSSGVIIVGHLYD